MQGRCLRSHGNPGTSQSQERMTGSRRGSVKSNYVRIMFHNTNHTYKLRQAKQGTTVFEQYIKYLNPSPPLTPLTYYSDTLLLITLTSNFVHNPRSNTFMEIKRSSRPVSYKRQLRPATLCKVFDRGYRWCRNGSIAK